jgi:type IV pilus assembly PilM-like protein
MFTKTKKVLGLAVEDTQILLAELHQSAGRYRVVHTETFPLPSEAGFTKPDLWAADLHQFLRTHQFSAKEAVIGLPAKWLLVKETEIPTVANDALGSVVQLMAEREFSLEMDDLVLDYTSSKNTTENRRLLVMATLRRRMEQILTAVRTAGLKVLSVTSSSLALFPSSNPSFAATRYMVYLRSTYAEIVEQNGVGFRSVKHVSFTQPDNREADSAPLGLFQQLNNYFALTPRPSGSADKEILIIWDGAEPQALYLETLEQHLKRPFDIRSGFDELNQQNWEWPNPLEAGRYVAPVFLAAAGLQTEPVTIDFLNSKVAIHTKSSHKKPLLYSAAAVAVLLILGLSMAWSWHQDSRAIAEMTTQLEEHKAEIEVAEELAQKISSVRSWYAGRPKVLDCMLELTQAFPEQGTIWVSSLALREDMRGIITGKSQNEAAFLDVLDKLNGNNVFSQPKMLYLRNTGRNSRDLAFAIDFLYTNGNVQPSKDINNNQSSEQPEVADNNIENLDVVTRK